jgi:formylglycine-generating enzyme required for sulfatase activity
MGKKPVNYVTWESCVRFVNWLSNGRGEGNTETGSYTIESGTVKVPDHAALAAEKAVKWVLPSENEWYKAAYYDPDKSGGAGYWLYPAKGDSEPTANLNSNAPSDVGSYSASAYGTFDQGGNAWEYNDAQNNTNLGMPGVGLRGGSFHINDHEGYMRSTARYDVLSAKWPNYGFRVAALGASESK